MQQNFTIGIVAPSALLPRFEFQIGIEKIEQAGFKVEVHNQCKKNHLFFAGTDEERAEALFEYAKNPKISVIWCARGGYGAVRLLPLLQQMALSHGKPEKKLLVGFSDVTALMDYVRREWGWSTMHAPMPTMRRFSLLDHSDWRAMCDWIMGKSTSAPWSKVRLSFWTRPPRSSIVAPMVGGNLTVWTSLLGTPFEPQANGSILFFEDVDEGLYRIDRMLQQLLLAKRLDGVKAIVLGNFLNCRDHCPSVLAVAPTPRTRKRMLTSPKPQELKPLRKIIGEKIMLQKIFTELGERLKIPVVFGLPVGHGPGHSPLPLGAEYRLTVGGQLELNHWDWIQNQ